MTNALFQTLIPLEGKEIILASQSPRRIAMLTKAGLNITSIPAEIDEQPDSYEDNVDFVRQNALAKAQWVQDRHPADLIIGADTIVIFEGEIMGKPENPKAAQKMLKTLSDREHLVITAFALLTPDDEVVESESTWVTFHPLSDKEIKAYIDTGEPFDKAGGYGIQGQASIFISQIEGDYYNVMGFPMQRFYQCLKEIW